MVKTPPATMDWQNLGFDYVDTGAHFRAYFRNGQWTEGEIVESPTVTMSHASPAIHLGQQCFEGLKAYRTKNGDIQLFRVDENAKRMVRSATKVLMEPYPEEQFVQAVHQIVKANKDWVPPYGTGSTLYIRPFQFGVGDVVGVGSGTEFVFGIYVTPVGPYFKGGLTPAHFVVSEDDRAAKHGTGAYKVGGNYAASYQAGKKAKEAGYADAVYLDPETRDKIEEVGSANFFGVTKDNVFVTPKSPSILPSITKYSLLHLAKEYLKMEAVEGEVYLSELNQFSEAGAMGTAAVITPVGSITHGDTVYRFGEEGQAGPVTTKLYELLTGIQTGDLEGPEGWVQKVNVEEEN